MLEAEKPLNGQMGLYASAVFDKKSGEIILKLVNTAANTQTRNILIQTKKKLMPAAKLTVLKSLNLNEVNTIDNPEIVVPVDQDIKLKGKSMNVSMAPYSFSVVRISTQK
jgi:alpha-L-arabinofuranosidase